MRVKDLIPFVENALDIKGNDTGQKFMSYGKIIDVVYNTSNDNLIKNVVLLQVMDVQNYLNFKGEFTDKNCNYTYKIREFNMKDLPEEFVMQLKYEGFK